jgi:transposase
VSRRAKARRGRPARSVSVKIIRALYAQGHSFRAISQTMGIGYGTVRRAFHGLAPAGADTGTGQKKPPERASKAARNVKAAGGR